ncbi:MAG: MFS transporter [Gammaproteobacteria bacterium]|nr:MFS transporter [Gammaproteobacteria bacterium]MBQ0840119.1 MFS transporter [Gammaproteobacteria bacterium]
MYYGWILLAIIGLIYMICVGAGFYGLSVMMPAMIDDLGWTRAEASAGFSLMAMVLGLSGPLITTMMKKIGPRLTIIIGGVICAISAGILYRYHSLTSYYFATGLLGLGLTMQVVLPGTQLITHWFQQRRAMALGIFMACGGLGGVIGAPVFTWLITHFDDWRPVWLAVGAVTLSASALSAIFIRNNPADMGLQIDGLDSSAQQSASQQKKAARVYKTTLDWTVADAIRDRNCWFVITAGAIAVTGHMIVSSQLVLHARDLGIGAVIAASALGVQGLATTAGRLLAGLLGDNTIEPRTIFIIGISSELIGMLLITSAAHSALLYAGVVFFGLGFGLGLVSATTMFANYYGAQNMATLLSYRILLGTMLGGAGVVICGYAADIFGGYSQAFYFYSALLLIGTALVVMIRTPQHE